MDKIVLNAEGHSRGHPPRQFPFSLLGKTMESTVCSVAQLCLTLCDPVDCSLPGFSVHGILWTRIVEGDVIAFSRRWRLWKVALFLLDILIPLPSQQLCSYKCPVFAWTFALFLPT